MNKIIFSFRAKPISDFDVEGDLICFLEQLESGDAVINTCNMLMITGLRAKLNSTHRHLIDITDWYYEDVLIDDMDRNLRCRKYWQYPVTCLFEDYLTDLLKLYSDDL